MKQCSAFTLFAGLWLAMLLVVFSVMVTAAVHSVSAQTAVPEICTIRTTDGLNLREGPGVSYPIKLALFEGDQVTPQAISEDRQWLHVAWQPKTAGQPLLIGWIQIGPDNVTCTIPFVQLPVASSPPAPSPLSTTIGPSPFVSFEAGWMPFPKVLGEQQRFQATVIIPSETLISDTVIFPGHMGFELRFDPKENLDDSTIESVTTTIFKGLDDEGTISVYHHVEYRAPYCAFGHTTEYCERTWDFAGTNHYWPQADSDQIEPGDMPIDPTSDYTAQMVMTLRDGTIGGEWDFHFKIQLRGAKIHSATTTNNARNWTEIDNPRFIDLDPQANLFVTPNGAVADADQSYNHAIGVWYDKRQKWAIYNQDHITPVPVGTLFNVLMIPTADPSVFTHATTLQNTANNWSEIDNVFTNGNASAILLVTQNWSPNHGAMQYNDHPVGVRYNRASQKWAIFNETGAAMPIGALFNVLVSQAIPPTVFVHRATVANTTNHWTELDNLRANGNPNAILLVTQNWNPGGGSGQVNEHLIGVDYNEQRGRWAISNQDQAAMPLGAAFNVVVAEGS